MSEKLYDEDGNPKEVPTSDEIRASLETEYQAKLQAAEAKAKQMEDEPIAQNFKMLRNKASAAEKQAEEYKKKLEELGHKPQDSQGISREEVGQMIAQRTQQAILEREKQRAFSQYDKETRSVVESYFNKITAGEELNPDSIAEYVQKAELLALPSNAGSPLKRVLSGSGRPPHTSKPEYHKTPEGQALAKKLGFHTEE